MNLTEAMTTDHSNVNQRRAARHELQRMLEEAQDKAQEYYYAKCQLEVEHAKLLEVNRDLRERIFHLENNSHDHLP